MRAESTTIYPGGRKLALLLALACIGNHLLIGIPHVAAQSAPSVSPQSFTEWIAQGDKYFVAQKYQEAIAAYSQAMQLNPRNDYAYYNRGNAHRKLKDYQAAIADYSLAIRLNPANALAYLYRGMVRQAVGEPPEAVLMDFNQAEKLDAEEVLIYVGRAEIHAAMGNRDAAIADYQKAGELYKAQKRYNNYEKVMSQIRQLRR